MQTLIANIRKPSACRRAAAIIHNRIIGKSSAQDHSAAIAQASEILCAAWGKTQCTDYNNFCATIKTLNFCHTDDELSRDARYTAAVLLSYADTQERRNALQIGIALSLATCAAYYLA